MSPARTYGPLVEPDGTHHARVAHSADYSIETPLYMRPVGNGRITCKMLRSPTPAKRLVQLVGEYYDGGVQVTHIVQCDDEADEIRQLERLERKILAASRRPHSLTIQ